MKSFKQMFKEQTYQFGSIQVDLSNNIKDKIQKFANQIPKQDLYIDDTDDSYGIEEDSHVTVRYGLDSPDINLIKSVFKNYGESSLRLCKLSIFEADKYDVLKIEIESDDLIKLNKMIDDNFDLPGETFKNYNPHSTIAYMKKGKAKKYIGNEEFKNITNDFNEITFSSKDGNHYKIKL